MNTSQPTNDRDTTIRRIRTALQRRSGLQWSVTGGRGTAWGWITIDAPPARRTWRHRLKPDASPAQLPQDYEEFDSGKPGGFTGPADRVRLAKLLGLEHSTHFQGANVPASSAHYREFIDRAEGRTPTAIAQPYWD